MDNSSKVTSKITVEIAPFSDSEKESNNEINELLKRRKAEGEKK